ncbi:MAG TPA: M48 family metallopeptidase [Rariglobus sp.]|jgi:Zn-dependent protease with chaperone function|nr:M48 family metallopeptidase [Rariglobus sp.]
MDFFEAQARAKKRTSRLVVLFAFAVLGVIAASYIAAIAGLSYTSPGQPWWDPQVLAFIALGTLVLVGLASAFKWFQLRDGGRAVAEMVGGRRVDPQTINLKERQLLNVVEEMAIASGVPMPSVYVLPDEEGINAFAAGLTTSDAVVAVTDGTLQKLTRDELQGVVAHEFSHILNGDMRLNLKITAIVFGILVIGLIGRGIIYNLRFTRVRSGNNKNGGGAIIAILGAGLALLLIGYAGYFFGRLIQAAVSRQREFLADASAVQFTRNPGGITGALKKIGGFALGSSLQSTKSAQIGHFFFAQGFRSNFGGLWATHPPLGERIQAIDPSFDGKYFNPPEVVDVAHKSWSEATNDVSAPLSGFAPTKPSPSSAGHAHAIVTSVGTLTAANVANAQTLLDNAPAVLREAVRSPSTASALICGLLLDTAPDQRARQQTLIQQHGGPILAAAVATLDPAIRSLSPEARLPLVLLSLPALHDLPSAELDGLLDTLDELVHADGRVTTFEFALQKVLSHHLALGKAPHAPGDEIYSFEAVDREIALVLSALARASADDEAGAAHAFAAGANQLRLLEGHLVLLSPAECSFEQLDAALDRLAQGSLPIKQRLLTASAHVITADGTVRVGEVELLRAFASALDCPMPALAA